MIKIGLKGLFMKVCVKERRVRNKYMFILNVLRAHCEAKCPTVRKGLALRGRILFILNHIMLLGNRAYNHSATLR